MNIKKYHVEVAVGIFILACLLAVGYLTIKLGKMEIIGADDYTIRARFQSVAGLKSGGNVVIAGVDIGKVSHIELNQEQMVAIVYMDIDSDIQLSEDSIASVKTSGLIGDKYIRISPGGSPDMLQPGDMIVDTESALDIEELVSKYVFGDVTE
jgi:phospholipid/cholesterol/gamma-HCH transport system substrate-binding protein